VFLRPYTACEYNRLVIETFATDKKQNILRIQLSAGCCNVQTRTKRPTFRRCLLPPSSRRWTSLPRIGHLIICRWLFLENLVNTKLGNSFRLLLQNSKFHYHICKSIPFRATWIQSTSSYSSSLRYISILFFNPKWFFSRCFLTGILHAFPISPNQAACPGKLTFIFLINNNIKRRVQITKLLIM
jgi:hypothetical protein